MGEFSYNTLELCFPEKSVMNRWICEQMGLQCKMKYDAFQLDAVILSCVDEMILKFFPVSTFLFAKIVLFWFVIHRNKALPLVAFMLINLFLLFCLLIRHMLLGSCFPPLSILLNISCHCKCIYSHRSPCPTTSWLSKHNFLSSPSTIWTLCAPWSSKLYCHSSWNDLWNANNSKIWTRI